MTSSVEPVMESFGPEPRFQPDFSRTGPIVHGPVLGSIPPEPFWTRPKFDAEREWMYVATPSHRFAGCIHVEIFPPNSIIILP
jgi:hypothetical protein